MIGTLSREDSKNYYVDLGRAHGILPKTEIIPGEELTMGSSIKVYVVKIELGQKGGPVILLSRSHYGFVKRLLELEIPELSDGKNILSQPLRLPLITLRIRSIGISLSSILTNHFRSANKELYDILSLISLSSSSEE